MVKARRRQLAALAANKDNTSGGLVDSSNSGTEGDLPEDNDWVIVKKQKITILVPPPMEPVVVRLTPQGPRTNQIQTKSKKKLKGQTQVPNKRCPLKGTGDDQKKSVGLASKEEIRIDERIMAAAHNPTKKLTNPTFKTASEGPIRLVRESMFQPPSLDFLHDQHAHGACGSSKAATVSGVLKAVERPTLPPPTCFEGPPLFLRSISCLNVGVLQNRRMRASNLERKLERAGGLSRWLMSLGLGQFVQMFQRKNVDKFQLLSLTMGKLKDMGADAVGPRRKLMHAIDCLSQPYCFNAF